MRKKIKALILLLIAVIIILAVIAGIVFLNREKALVKSERISMIEALTTDQSMYSPGDKINISCVINNGTENKLSGRYEVVLKHLDQTIGKAIIKSFTVGGGEKAVLQCGLTAPEKDFQGYLIEFTCADKAGNYDTETVGVDVSSNWTKFPRYGYVWDYTKNVDTAQKIELLKSYHINALQYYDWQYRHHKPLADNQDKWNDWSGRIIYGDIVRGYISEAKKYNIVNMAYNMIYAATNSYIEDGINDEWGLWYAEDKGSGHHLGDRFTFHMNVTSTGQSDLFFFDPTNSGWQNYIFGQEIQALEAFGFDGWHGDTIGEQGKMWRYDEIGDETKGFYVKDTYTEFLNAAKAALGDKYYLTFNPVGAQGIENVNVSNADVLYSEIWPWDKDIKGRALDTYNSLKNVIDQSREESNGKSLVIPAYIEYDYGESTLQAPFNISAVLLADAAVYAAGGSRFELGDGENMLCNEYFPDQNLYMSEELIRRELDLYDFITAYENILRDGQTETENGLEFIDYKFSRKGDPEKIWAYTKEDADYEIIQMINLTGVSGNDWRADTGIKDTPDMLKDVKVKYYPSKAVQAVWVTSPDPAFDGRSKLAAFERGSDAGGDYITFTVPSLEYWDVVYMSDKAGAAPDMNDSIGIADIHWESSGDIVNGSFENGLQGWRVWENHASADSTEAADGSSCCKISSDNEIYNETISQTVTGLENGSYEVTAQVKEGEEGAVVGQMELTGFGGISAYQTIPKGDEFSEVKAAADVKNGRLNITFRYAANNGGKLYIDKVVLKKAEKNSEPQVVNGGFESGVDGWTVTGNHYGTDANDRYSGTAKLYFYGIGEYEQKIEQTVEGLDNAVYEVSAMVKQQTGVPKSSKMIVSDYGKDPVSVDLEHNNDYEKISIEVEVTAGRLTIAFYQTNEGESNLQVDDVMIKKIN